jgi:hypothetical protein
VAHCALSDLAIDGKTLNGRAASDAALPANHPPPALGKTK